MSQTSQSISSTDAYTQIKYANIIVESTPRALAYPGLYYHADQPVLVREVASDEFASDELVSLQAVDISGSSDSVTPSHSEDPSASSHSGASDTEIILTAAGTFDFTTYFNALSVAKLHKYTRATNFSLHLELTGAACTYVQTMGDRYAAQPSEVDGTSRDFAASDRWISMDIPLTVTPEMVITGFMLHTQGQVRIRHASYKLQIDGPLCDAELALITTTYRKESYITRNIERIQHEILNGDTNRDADIAHHFSMIVVDNGRSLDAEALSAPRISILPNDNVGGAGGFARGMIAAMDQLPQATHVLLMDDDVDVSPESIKRTYALLGILRDEYAEAFISGAMLSYEVGDEQWEDTGYMTTAGAFAPAKPPLRMTQFEDIIYNEDFEVSPSLDGQRYASWWYCCIPIATIKREGLPLPLFVRSDDAEYSMRCNPKFITMNGLCIWHMAFQSRYNEAVERYQTTRNTMIAQATTGMAPQSNFMTELDHNIHLELQKFGYYGAQLCLDAFEDFLKGPEFIKQPGIAESSFMRANKRKEQLVPFDELMRQTAAIPELADFDIAHIDRFELESDKPRSLMHRLQDRFIDNGQHLLKSAGEGYAVIPALGWAYPAGVIRSKKYLIVIDWANGKGAIRCRDQRQYDAIMKRYLRDLRYYKKHKSEILAAYAAARDELTSLEYWKRYLSLN